MVFLQKGKEGFKKVNELGGISAKTKGGPSRGKREDEFSSLFGILTKDKKEP